MINCIHLYLSPKSCPSVPKWEKNETSLPFLIRRNTESKTLISSYCRNSRLLYLWELGLLYARLCYGCKITLNNWIKNSDFLMESLETEESKSWWVGKKMIIFLVLVTWEAIGCCCFILHTYKRKHVNVSSFSAEIFHWPAATFNHHEIYQWTGVLINHSLQIYQRRLLSSSYS